MDTIEAIKKRVLDYVEGWYTADGARMQRALSPYLAKRRVVSNDEIWDVNKDWMVEATHNGRGKIADPENGLKEITILDHTDTVASVKLISNDFIDYLHLVNTDGEWAIVNALWDYRQQ